jgi:hypothetical protein
MERLHPNDDGRLTPRQRELILAVLRLTRRLGRSPLLTEIAGHLGVHPASALRLARRAVAAGNLTHEPRTVGTWQVVDRPPATRAKRACR